MSSPRQRHLGGLVLLTAVVLLFPTVAKTDYALGRVIEILFFVGLCSAWNIVGGFAGQFAFAHSIYIGAGAYAAALCADRGVSPFLGLAIGAAASVALGCLIAWMANRFELPRLAFALITLAFSEIGLLFVLTSDPLGGPSGFAIPFQEESSLAMLQFDSGAGYYFVVAAVALLTIGVSIWVYHSRWGLYYRCVRDNERAGSAIGVSPLRVKLHSMAISAALTSLMGGVYALYVGFVDPHELAGPSIIIQVILFTAVGGMGSIWGPVLGAATLVTLGDVLREQFGTALPPGSHALIYGVAVVLVLLLGKEGLVPTLAALGARVRRWLPRSDPPEAPHVEEVPTAVQGHQREGAHR